MLNQALICSEKINFPPNASFLICKYEKIPGYGELKYQYADDNKKEVLLQDLVYVQSAWEKEILRWIELFVNDSTLSRVNMCLLTIDKNLNYTLDLKFQKNLDLLRIEEHRLNVGDEEFKEDYAEYLQSLPDGYHPPKFTPEKLIKSMTGKLIVSQNDRSADDKLEQVALYKKNRLTVESNAASWRAKTAHITESQALGTIREHVTIDLPEDAVEWAVQGRIKLPDPMEGETKVHLSGTWWFKRRNVPHWENFIPSSTLGALHAIRRLRDIYADDGNEARSILVRAKVGESKACIDLDPTNFPEEN